MAPFMRMAKIRKFDAVKGRRKKIAKTGQVRRINLKDTSICMEQQNIKEGQRKAREKFEAIELECEELRKETMLIVKQSAAAHLRLVFKSSLARLRTTFDKALRDLEAETELNAVQWGKMSSVGSNHPQALQASAS